MSTCKGPASSKQGNRKTCQACNKEFLCGAMGPGCWCEEIHLTAAARDDIARRYEDCLCRDCLSKFQSRDDDTPAHEPDLI